jgi:uncharacterized protein YecE (DUF72 family)
METTQWNTRLVGCAGWGIPGALAGRFPGPGSHLARYARQFGAVEINSSFYRPHRAETYARWAASVPDDFRFSVKLPRHITHELRLLNIDDALARFTSEVTGLGPHLGCVLIQLPPSAAFDAGLAQDAFTRLRRNFNCMLACEARNPSWFSDEATALMREQAITRVIADPAKGQSGAHMPTTANIYVRLHGSPRVYYSSYPDVYLDALAEDLRVHAEANRRVWLIFDNTASGAATSNALRLRLPRQT